MKVEPNLYNEEVIYPDCTVQILKNTITGEESVGWWENKRKTKPLRWMVYAGDFNSKNIKEHNIFNHWRFWGYCRENYKKNKERSEFEKQLRKDLAYCYWGKCEWEIVVQHWPPREGCKDIKVDCYEQIRMNWDRFTDYVWENRREFRWKEPRNSS